MLEEYLYCFGKIPDFLNIDNFELVIVVDPLFFDENIEGEVQTDEYGQYQIKDNIIYRDSYDQAPVYDDTARFVYVFYVKYICEDCNLEHDPSTPWEQLDIDDEEKDSIMDDVEVLRSMNKITVILQYK
jgi:hypothetical protein